MSMRGISRVCAAGVLAMALGAWGPGCERDSEDHFEEAGESLRDAGEDIREGTGKAVEEAGEAMQQEEEEQE